MISDEAIRKKVVEDAVKAMSEQWDNVQVFCSAVDQGNTHRYWLGAGNIYARHGLCREWVEREIAVVRQEGIDSMNEEEQ